MEEWAQIEYSRILTKYKLKSHIYIFNELISRILWIKPLMIHLLVHNYDINFLFLKIILTSLLEYSINQIFNLKPVVFFQYYVEILNFKPVF